MSMCATADGRGYGRPPRSCSPAACRHPASIAQTSRSLGRRDRSARRESRPWTGSRVDRLATKPQLGSDVVEMSREALLGEELLRRLKYLFAPPAAAIHAIRDSIRAVRRIALWGSAVSSSHSLALRWMFALLPTLLARRQRPGAMTCDIPGQRWDTTSGLMDNIRYPSSRLPPSVDLPLHG
jgi:hypothetical protein